MTKRFELTIENGKPTCPELKGYELPELHTPRTPIAIEVEMAKPSESFGAFVGNSIGEFVPALNPDGTVKGVYIYE